MTLRADVKKTLADLDSLQSAVGGGAVAGDLVAVSRELTDALGRAGPSFERLDRFEKNELLDPEAIATVKDLRGKIAGCLTKFEQCLVDTPTQPKRGRSFANLKNVLLTASTTTSEKVKASWKTTRERVTEVNRRFDQAASSEDDVVEALSDLIDQLNDKKWKSPPETAADLENHEVLLSKAERLGRELKTVEVPASVAEFLERADRSEGASFHMITPEIYQWLRENPNVGGTLRVSRGK